MNNFIDMTGQKYGKLTILEKDTSNNGNMYWICQCECGVIKSIRGTDIRAGKTISCGCNIKTAASGRKRDLTGQRFGRLTVLQDSGRRNSQQKVIWECQCDCGNISYVVSTQLTSGKTQSCGCLQKERTSLASIKNLSNQRFGKLVALQPTKDRKDGRVIWNCICDCGNSCQVTSHNLLNGGTSSCGCLTQSKGVSKIEELLQENHISYIKEKTFNSCRFEDTCYCARFDFYIQDKYLLEFDGPQHFQVTSGWGTLEQLEKTQAHDQFKNQWCKDNNIPLIRIPYSQVDQLCIKDLLLETSSFVV